MILLLALVLAFLLFPWPWNFGVIVAAAVCETSVVVIGMWYTRRGRSQVGTQTLIGGTAEVITTLAPTGQVKLRGEIWQAHSEEGAQIGETVLIRSVKDLTLQVDRTD